MNKVSRIAIPPAVQGLLPAFFCIFSGVIDRLYLDIDSFLVSMTCNGLYGSGRRLPGHSSAAGYRAGASGTAGPLGRLVHPDQPRSGEH